MFNFTIYKTYQGKISVVHYNVFGRGTAQLLCKMYNYFNRADGNYYYFK